MADLTCDKSARPLLALTVGTLTPDTNVVAQLAKVLKVAKPAKAIYENVAIKKVMKPALRGKGKKGTALGGKGKEGNIANVLRYAILCCQANCPLCSPFNDETLTKNNLTVDNIEWDDTMTFVDLLWHPVPANFKRIKAFTKMKDHLVKIYGLSGDDFLPSLFRKGTQRMEETKKNKLSLIRNRNNPSGQDLPIV